MIPIEEHSPNRNLSLNLNNITNTNNGNNHSSNTSDMSNTTTTIITINNLHQDNDLCDEDLIDENTKLLSYEKQANGDAMKPNLNHHQQNNHKNQKNKIIMKNVTTTNNCDEIQKNGHVTSAIKSDNNVEFLGNKLKILKKNMEEQKQNQQQQQQQEQKDQNQQNQQKKVTLKR